LLYFTARDLLAAGPRPAKDLERFTRTLLMMGNRALATDRQGTSASRRVS
jgi:hypothetical protein